MPDVEGDIGNRFLGGKIADDTVHVGDGTLVLVLDDGVAELPPCCVWRPEGPKDCGGGGDVVRVFGLDVIRNLCDKATWYQPERTETLEDIGTLTILIR